MIPSNFCRYLFYVEFLASGNAILLTTGFYDRIHELDSELITKGTAKDCALYGKKPISQRLFNGL